MLTIHIGQCKTCSQVDIQPVSNCFYDLRVVHRINGNVVTRFVSDLHKGETNVLLVGKHVFIHSNVRDSIEMYFILVAH